MMFDTKRSLRAALLASATGLVAMGPAMAQDSPGTQDEEEYVDEIVVTGFKAALNRSTEIKKNNSSIVEAISAEEIGKLPDVSIAESLARLPGLAAQRLRGRAQVISVRGLGPDFTTALLNGREQVTAGDNRGVEFDQYPSELLSSVVVYKTPEASLLGQGLAGTIDLRTIRPLDYSERTISGSARYETNDLGIGGADDTGFRLTGTYVDQLADNSVGVMVGVAFQESPTLAERWEAWGYDPVSGPLGGVDSEGNAIDGDPRILTGAKPYAESRSLDRTSVVGTLQFEPTEALSLTFDAFYSNFKDEGKLNGVEIPLAWGDVSPQPGFTVEDGLITSGVYTGRRTFDRDGDGDIDEDDRGPGIQGVVRNDFRGREADIWSLGGNAQWDLSETVSAELDLSYSSVERDDIDVETYTGTGRGFGNGASEETLPFTLTERGFTFQPTLNYADPDLFLLTDPRGWGQSGFIKQPKTDDELYQLRASVKKEFVGDGLFGDALFSSLELGGNFTTREKNKISEEAFIRPIEDTARIPDEILDDPVSLAFLGFGDVISYDPVALFEDYQGTLITVDPNTNADVLTKAFQVQEDVLTGWLMADIATELDGMPLTGNVGVQVVRTDQNSLGNAAGSDNNGNPIISSYKDGDKYTDVLPSLNLNLNIAEGWNLRFAAAKTLARARFDQLSASQGIGLNQNICGLRDEDGDGDADDPFFDESQFNPDNGQYCIGAGGGNPQLKPYTATAIDLSLERYFGDGNYISIAGFTKELDDFIFGSAQSEIDTTEAATALFGADFVAANPNVAVGSLSRPVNLSGGNIRGIELAANVTADTFVDNEVLGGLGIFASYSVTDSEIDPDPDDDQGPIAVPGLSEEIANVTVFYELAGFEARVSQRYRSDFLGEVTGFGANRETRNIQSEKVVDAQIGYRFGNEFGGTLDGVSVLLQANNLTDEEFVTVINGDPRQIRNYEVYGTTYLLGVNFTF